MEEIIRSASLGPPIRAAKAAGSRPREEGGAASGSLADAAEFSTPHLRRLLSPGSIVVLGEDVNVDVDVDVDLERGSRL